MGDSAGGGLTLSLLSLLVARARDLSGLRPAAAAVMSPWADLALSGESMETREEADHLMTRDFTLPRVDAMAAKGKDGKLWVEITNVDPHQAAEVDLNVTGINAKSASGEILTAPKVDSVNTFESPNTVVPKPISARAQGGKLTLQLEPKSVTVVSVEQ